MLQKAIEFTGDHIKYGNAMREVVNLWENTMINHLTNPSINKRAFVGHCAVCYKIGIPEHVTRKAWKYLNKRQQVLADNEAQNTINEWLKKYQSTLKNGKEDAIKKEYQMKLQLN